MDSTSLVLTVQAVGGGYMVWGMFCWCILGSLILIEDYLNATAFVNVVADHVNPFMATSDTL